MNSVSAKKDDQIARELITFDGKRKYLTQNERVRFLAAATDQHRGEVRTLCMTLAYTGCRISEALECDTGRVDFSARTITFRTLKQRGKTRHRAVPIPDALLDTLGFCCNFEFSAACWAVVDQT